MKRRRTLTPEFKARAVWEMTSGKKSLMQAALVLTLLAACTFQNPAGMKKSRLIVFAAASLNEAFSELAAQFEADNPGTQIVFNFAGSQQLAQHLAQGAPAEVFASADLRQMNNAVKMGRVAAEQVRPFASNHLVVVYPADNPGEIRELEDLARRGIRLGLASEAVPAGQYALEFLDNAAQDPAYGPQFKAQVLENVVSYEENVRAVLSKVILGEVDAGIVYQSDVSTGNAGKVGVLAIPEALNVTASYYLARVADAQNAALAEKFIAWVLSPEGQEVLGKLGFAPCPP